MLSGGKAICASHLRAVRCFTMREDRGGREVTVSCYEQKVHN
eukprot:SAG31_NODE_1072_length_10065_cov_2.900662_8_plen_42_part_00